MLDVFFRPTGNVCAASRTRENGFSTSMYDPLSRVLSCIDAYIAFSRSASSDDDDDDDVEMDDREEDDFNVDEDDDEEEDDDDDDDDVLELARDDASAGMVECVVELVCVSDMFASEAATSLMDSSLCSSEP